MIYLWYRYMVYLWCIYNVVKTIYRYSNAGKSTINESLIGKNIYTGWWYTDPSEKYEFVSWDDEIPNRWTTIKQMFQTTNQCISI